MTRATPLSLASTAPKIPPGAPVDSLNLYGLSSATTVIAFDIVGDFTLSKQFGCVGNSGNHLWVALIGCKL
jgi:hypothetical protein